MISAMPNTPIATTAMPMPSESSGTPKSKRSLPELTSVPTMPMSKPATTIARDFSSDPDPIDRRTHERHHHEREILRRVEA